MKNILRYTYPHHRDDSFDSAAVFLGGMAVACLFTLLVVSLTRRKQQEQQEKQSFKEVELNQERTEAFYGSSEVIIQAS